MQFSRQVSGFFGFLTLSIAAAEPIIPGLHAKHPLTPNQEGQVLVNELRCAACHADFPGEMKSAPDLREVGSRISGDYLQRFLLDPHGTHPGTTMPDVLAHLPPKEKKAVSKSISHYLMSLTRKETTETTSGDAKAGVKIYHETGCIACHSPRDDSGRELSSSKAASLAHLPGKYRNGELAKFLLDPLATRPSGRMPNLKLSSKEAAALEAYLIGDTKPKAAELRSDLVKLGKANFEKHNCTSCHSIDGTDSQSGPSLSKLNLDDGCLTNQKANYNLSSRQKTSLKSFLTKPVTYSKSDHLEITLTTLNCISCHQRDDYGGVSQNLDPYFHSTEEALGNEARIPPPLTKAGGKLKPEWLQKVLYDGMSVRPYMTTRMPQYGRSALHALPDLLVEVDHLPELKIEPPSREERPMINNGGHLLLGTEGLNCISCHNYNGKESPGMKGYDLIWSYQRLQPAWFSDFMKNPSHHRPGIIMPNYWPDGKAVQKDILGGDTDEQLRALWFQFSLGRSARDPKGLTSKPNELIVTGKVRVYRGRSRVAGYRGIAVGYPKGLNYAFNAQNGSLAAIWKGRFVNANWRSQAAGDFSPAERSIALPQDLAFLKKSEIKESWPLMSTTTKDAPVNPDPLYPRNHGYAFRGYSFDATGNPTFKYKCSDIVIEDQSSVIGETTLRRTFKITSSPTDTLIFRALTGEFKAESNTEFATKQLRLKLGSGSKLFKSGPQELLIELPLINGTNTFSFDYEILR